MDSRVVWLSVTERRSRPPGKDASYSFREPEWPAVCECKYDEARDEMDQEDCPFHCELADNSAAETARTVTRKRPTLDRNAKESAA